METTMKIDAYILCWNEEKILPFTLDHYTKYCNVVYLLDNMSDDSSLEIASRYSNVQVLRWKQPDNKLNDLIQARLKSTIYTNSIGKADWVVVVDADELVYNLESLKDIPKGSIPRIQGAQMMCEEFPKYTGESILNLVKTGYYDKDFCKQAVFPPESGIQFGPGAHSASILPNVDSNLKLLHYKYLGRDYIKWKNKRSADRLSDTNKNYGFGTHYLQSDAQTDYHFDVMSASLLNII